MLKHCYRHLRYFRNISDFLLALLLIAMIWQISLWLNTNISQEEEEPEIIINPQQTEDELLLRTIGYRPNAEFDQWQELSSTEKRLFVFSAYFDDRHNTTFVRIIAVAAIKRKKPLYCHFHDENDAVRLENSQAILRIHKETFSLPYSSYFLLCQVPRHFIPSDKLYVMISETNNSLSKSVIKNAGLLVHQNKVLDYEMRFLAVCVKPMHYRYNRALWLLEFIEMHRLFGAEHFYFYNHTIGNEVDQVLRFYMEAGIVTIIPWQLDLVSQKEIRTEGIFASLNDCLYRTMYRYKYTAMLDFDEFIVPKKDDNYKEMMRKLDDKSRISSYVFRNVFFYLYWQNDTSFVDEVKRFLPHDTKIPYLLTLFKTQRIKKPHNHAIRSKYIVKPELCVLVGNHVVWDHLPDPGNWLKAMMSIMMSQMTIKCSKIVF